MFSIPGVLGLIFMTYVRPQAFVMTLKGVPLLHLVYLLALIGFAIDLRTRLLRPKTAPLLWHAVVYFAWAFITLARAQPSLLGAMAPSAVIVFALFFMVAQAVQGFRALKAAVIALSLIAMFLSVVGIDQGTSPRGCYAFMTSESGAWDGRYCDDSEDCHREGDPGMHYACEKIGMFGTHSVNGRARWLGIIEDPNELAMCVSLCVPLLIGLYLLRPSARSLTTLIVGAGVFVTCTVYTQSRGGQLVFLAAVAVYFVRRYGIRGAVIVGVLAAPVLLLGGRSGQEAEESKMERIEALNIAMNLMKQHPFFGCGWTQFTEYNFLTAHNSYALSAAEMGIPGLTLFISILYQAMKAFVTAAKRYSNVGPSRVAYVWAGALMAALTGLMTGVLFLSFNFSAIFWTFMGICSGFQLACKRHDPEIDFVLRGRDWRRVIVISLLLAVGLYFYSHWKMAGH